MFDGRHCVEKDLKLLEKETKRIISLINEDNYSELDEYLKLISRFDNEISNNIRAHISNKRKDDIKLIEANILELKQDVIVDIFEHQ